MRRSMLKSVALGTALASSLMLGSASTGLAQGTATSYSAFIVAGDCAAIPTTSVAELNTVQARSGTAQGAATQTMLFSDTDDDTLTVGLQELLAQPHAIVVTSDLADPAAAIACGAIGGVPDDNDDDGDLVIALASANDSGFFGVAELDGDDDDDELEVDIHLAAPDA